MTEPPMWCCPARRCEATLASGYECPGWAYVQDDGMWKCTYHLPPPDDKETA